jgi:hypothetical protein
MRQLRIVWTTTTTTRVMRKLRIMDAHSVNHNNNNTYDATIAHSVDYNDDNACDARIMRSGAIME